MKKKNLLTCSPLTSSIDSEIFSSEHLIVGYDLYSHRLEWLLPVLCTNLLFVKFKAISITREQEKSLETFIIIDIATHSISLNFIVFFFFFF